MTPKHIFSALLALSAATSQAIPPTAPLLSPTPAGYEARAAEFSEAALFNAVLDQLQRLETGQIPAGTEECENILIMAARAYEATGDPRCLGVADRILALYPDSGQANTARLVKADFHFFAHDFAEALAIYNTVDYRALDNSQLPQATYRRALSMIRCGYFKDARQLLSRLADNKEYSLAAKYYTAYTLYASGDYSAAYTLFQEVDRSLPNLAPRPSSLVPKYYMSQIDYIMGRYADAATASAALLKRGMHAEMELETLRVAGMSRFKTGDDLAALPYLEKYVAKAGEDSNDEARYALGEILFKEGSPEDIDRAADLFATLTSQRDALGQGAQFYLGKIAAARGDYNAAAMAFEHASRMAFDSDIARMALYNYAAALTHGGNVPFGSPADILEQYLQAYPDAEHSAKVREYLASVSYNSGDYARALGYADRISAPSPEQKALQQKILFALGRRSLSEGNPSAAAGYLQRAASMGDLTPGLLPQARLWLGDALFGQGKWEQAEKSYASALKGNLSTPNRALAFYGQGYALMRQNSFAKAGNAFRSALATGALPASMTTDARLRIADSKLYSGQRAEALADYSNLKQESAGADADYAAYRHAMILGASGDTRGQIAELAAIAPNASPRWKARILSALGTAYVADGNDPKARDTFRTLISQCPGATEEVAAADSELRRIYAAEGRLKEYADFLAASGSGLQLDKDSMQQLEFDAALQAYNRDSGNLKPLRSFVDDYPNSPNAPEALSMLAEGYEEAGEREEAALAYSRLETAGGSAYAADAAIGVMRNTDDPNREYAYALRVASMGGIPAETRQEALFCQGEALADLNRPAEAREIWTDLAANPESLQGARAAVALGQNELDAGEYDKAEKTLLDLIDSGTPHDYWLARGYIALADVYTKTGRKSLARQYLTTLRANYPGNDDDIHTMIQNRL